VRGNLQTVIVIMMSRELVEKFLGSLEGQGYLADRLELPILDELLATPVTADGAYIYPTARRENSARSSRGGMAGRCIISACCTSRPWKAATPCSANNSRKWPGRANWKAGWKVHRAASGGG